MTYHAWLAMIHVMAGTVMGFVLAWSTIKVHVTSRDHLRGMILGIAVIILAALTLMMAASGNLR